MGRRPAKAVRDINKVAFTRYSKKVPKKSYIRAMPHRNLHMFNMGVIGNYEITLDLVSEKGQIIRDCALESSRITINKELEKKLSGAYFFKILVFPFHVIRENKMISGAGADRLQKGMRQSFGRTTDVAARLAKGQVIYRIQFAAKSLDVVKDAVKHAINKLGGRFRAVVTQNGG